MMISEKQILILLQCLRDTLGVHSPEFTLPNQHRVELYAQIINQQSEELKEIE